MIREPATSRNNEFLSTLSLRRATDTSSLMRCQAKFLSTLSLRRATRCHSSLSARYAHFYPRSPCGERHLRVLDGSKSSIISIHALLAESDIVNTVIIAGPVLFLSTLSLRRATRLWTILYSCPGNFYPRSPCGERPTDMIKRLTEFRISIHALLAESD